MGEQLGMTSPFPTSLTTFLTGRFYRIFNSYLFNENCNFLEVRVTFSYHFSLLLLIWITLWVILGIFTGSCKIKISKVGDPSWPPFENVTQFLCHMRPIAHVKDLKGNVFLRTICNLSFVAVALIF